MNSYTDRHSPDLSLDQKIKRGYQHLSEKFGTHGYAINFRESYLQANSLSS